MKSPIKVFKNRKVLRAIMALFVVGVLVGSYLYYEKKKNRIQIDNSLIQTPIISVNPSTAGKLSKMNVYDGQTVKKGDDLATVGSDIMHSDTDGLIIMANNAIGGSVSPQTTIIQMINPNYMRVAGTIDENKGLNEIKIGQVVSFTVDALPGKTFWGYVDEISPSAKQTQLSFSISSERPVQQFQVFAKFDATAHPEIKNGMSAKMVVYTKTP